MADEEMLVRAAIRDELSGPLERIREELRGAAREAENAGRKANIGARGFDRMASGVGRFVKAGVGMAARAAATGVAVLTAAAVAGSVKVLQLASDAAETASAFGTVFKGVSGDVAGYVKRMNREFGITTAELQTAATTFGVFGKAAGVSRKDLGGFTKDLTTAGLDLSSFYNADPSEVFMALRSGLSGEAEPLRQFGIFLSDAALKAQAASQGLTGELTDQQKVMLRQQIILKSLGDAEGDLARTKDGLANKTKALKGRLTEMGTTIGTALLPYAERAANVLDQKLAGALKRLPAQLDAAEAKVLRVAGAGRKLYDTFKGQGLDGVVTQLDNMTGAGGKLESAWAKVKSIASDVATIYSGSLKPALDDVAAAIPFVVSPLTLLDNTLGFMADHTTLTRVALTGLVAALTLAKAATIAHSIVTGISTALLTARVATTALLTGTIALNTGATLTNTQASIAANIIRARTIAMTIAHKVATVASTIATKAARAATMAWAAVQWVLNAALTANPIGLVIAAIALLVGGVILAYKKSDTFRGIVDGLWAAIKTAWEWIKKIVVAVADFILKWTPMGRLLKLGIDNFDKIKAAIGYVVDKINDLVGAIANIDWPEPPGWVKDVGGAIGGLLGDTSTSRARGGNFAGTMATHASVSAATGARPTITNAFVGGGGAGRGSGDHQAGRALDLTGKGLAKYGAHMRAIGGYAAFHGSGSGRHLHAVPPAMGDTSRSMARSVRGRASSGGTGGGVTIAEGAVRVEVTNPATNVDVAAAVAQGIRDYVREREERA